MTSAVLDTNVILQGVLRRRHSASAQVLDLLLARGFAAYGSIATWNELIHVLMLPHIRLLHGLGDDELLDLLADIADRVTIISCGPSTLPPSLVRDVTDLHFLGVCEAVQAEYLVTNDRRHLGRLGTHAGTNIVGPGKFLNMLASASSE